MRGVQIRRSAERGAVLQRNIHRPVKTHTVSTPLHWPLPAVSPLDWPSAHGPQANQENQPRLECLRETNSETAVNNSSLTNDLLAPLSQP